MRAQIICSKHFSPSSLLAGPQKREARVRLGREGGGRGPLLHFSWHSEAVDVVLGVAELGEVGLARAIEHGRRAAPGSGWGWGWGWG